MNIPIYIRLLPIPNSLKLRLGEFLESKDVDNRTDKIKRINPRIQARLENCTERSMALKVESESLVSELLRCANPRQLSQIRDTLKEQIDFYDSTVKKQLDSLSSEDLSLLESELIKLRESWGRQLEQLDLRIEQMKKYSR